MVLSVPPVSTSFASKTAREGTHVVRFHTLGIVSSQLRWYDDLDLLLAPSLSLLRSLPFPLSTSSTSKDLRTQNVPRAPNREAHHGCQQRVEEEESWVAKDVARRFVDEDCLVESDGPEGRLVRGGEVDEDGES